MKRVFLLTFVDGAVVARELVDVDFVTALTEADGPALAVLIGDGIRGAAMNDRARGAPLQAMRAWVRDRGGVW